MQVCLRLLLMLLQLQMFRSWWIGVPWHRMAPKEGPEWRRTSWLVCAWRFFVRCHQKQECNRWGCGCDHFVICVPSFLPETVDFLLFSSAYKLFRQLENVCAALYLLLEVSIRGKWTVWLQPMLHRRRTICCVRNIGNTRISKRMSSSSRPLTT